MRDSLQNDWLCNAQKCKGPTSRGKFEKVIQFEKGCKHKTGYM